MDSLIKIEGKPIEKLLQVVSDAIGTLYEPRQIVRKAKAAAKAESIIAVEQAKTKAIIEGDIEKAQYLERINERLVIKETKRQKNIEEVVTTAGKILETEKDVSEEPVNQDWATRFFDIVQDVSDNEMQLLWGQILAGEIKRPQSYSLRTLETLRNMTKDEAELFQKVVQFALGQGELFVFYDDKVLNRYGINYSHFAKLIEIGLFQSGDFVEKTFHSKEIDDSFGIRYGNLVVIINRKAKSPSLSIPIKALTKSGQELASLITITPNLDYVKSLASSIKKRTNARIFYAVINNIEEDGVIEYQNSIEI